MSSPFSTFEEFSSAEGPIYTFANNSVMLTLLLVISLIISVYFFYASFGMKQELTKSPDLKAIGLLLIAGFVSLIGALHNPHPQPPTEAVHSRTQRQEQVSRRTWQPLVLLGLTGIGSLTHKRNQRRSSRSDRRSVGRSRPRF